MSETIRFPAVCAGRLSLAGKIPHSYLPARRMKAQFSEWPYPPFPHSLTHSVTLSLDRPVEERSRLFAFHLPLRRHRRQRLICSPVYPLTFYKGGRRADAQDRP